MARSGGRSRFTVVVLVLVCLTLITIDSRANGGGALGAVRSRARDVLVPAESAIRNVTDPVADTVDGLFDGGSLRAENRRLREENERLRGQIDEGLDSRRELRAILEANKLDYAGDLPRVAARVVNTAPQNLALTVEIDKGSDDGIVRDLPVVTGAGLVGKVEAVSGKRSQVLLLTDPRLKVGVRLGETNSVVSVHGQGNDRPLSMDLVKKGTQVAVDDIVVTSGLQGSFYPKGIPVGRVAAYDARPGVAYERVDVRTTVDFSRLEYVFVLQVRGGEDPFAGKSSGGPTTTTTFVPLIGTAVDGSDDPSSTDPTSADTPTSGGATAAGNP